MAAAAAAEAAAEAAVVGGGVAMAAAGVGAGSCTVARMEAEGAVGTAGRGMEVTEVLGVMRCCWLDVRVAHGTAPGVLAESVERLRPRPAFSRSLVEAAAEAPKGCGATVKGFVVAIDEAGEVFMVANGLLWIDCAGVGGFRTGMMDAGVTLDTGAGDWLRSGGAKELELLEARLEFVRSVLLVSEPSGLLPRRLGLFGACGRWDGGGAGADTAACSGGWEFTVACRCCCRGCRG